MSIISDEKRNELKEDLPFEISDTKDDEEVIEELEEQWPDEAEGLV